MQLRPSANCLNYTNTDLILESLKRLVNYNVFTFGNKFFIQINGTIMGTNAACMYAAI